MFIHPAADVQTTRIGAQSRIWQFAVVLQGASIGENCNINSHTFIENDVVIGNNVTIKCGVYLWDGIRIHNNVFIGPNATFTNDKFPRSKQYPSAFQPIIIEEGASIGANATILGGITIGKHAMIGAGSVVTRNVPANELWVGNPARFVKKLGN
ncbi:MAG: N-acetyltransferase [Bacteroidia bacterium]|nr:N-acetyltransferase [Bacteroidia bacterium]